MTEGNKDKEPKDSIASRTSATARRSFPVGFKDGSVDSYLILGLLVGLSMTATGIFLQAQNPVSARLVLVCGLGIVLGAFGTTATINFKPYVIGGCGAIALILGWFLENQVRGSYAVLQLDGVPTGSTVQIFGEQNFYSTEVGGGRLFEFVAMQRHIGSRVIGAVIATPDGKEVVLECLSNEAKDSITKQIGAHGKLFWTFDHANGAMFDNNNKLIAEVSTGCTRGERKRTATFTNHLVSAAHAKNLPDAKAVLKDIESTSVLTRRTARDSLAGLGVDAVGPALEAFAAENASYRTRLGVLVALAKMLENDRSKLQGILAKISQKQLAPLVQAAVSKDKTMRSYATEFLVGLEDPRSVSIALDEFENADESGKYNLLLVIKGAMKSLEPAERAATGERIQTFDLQESNQTASLVNEILKLENSATEKKFWVIVGSFRDRSAAQNWAKEINSNFPKFKAFVGLPRPENPYFPVIVGEYIERPEAEKLRQEVLSDLEVHDAYLGSFPGYKE